MNKKKIVFIPMVVDFIHKGHLNIIKKSRKYGDITIGLLTDSAVKIYKPLPIFQYKHRLAIIKSMKNVSKVEKTEDWDYSSALERIKPDYVVHGDDWKSINPLQRKNVMNRLKKWGGRLIEFPYTKGISSSSIKKDIIIKIYRQDLVESQKSMKLTNKKYKN